MNKYTYVYAVSVHSHTPDIHHIKDNLTRHEEFDEESVWVVHKSVSYLQRL